MPEIKITPKRSEPPQMKAVRPVVKDLRIMKLCPNCGEQIRANSKKCPFCGRQF